MFIIRGILVYGGIIPVEPFVTADPVPSEKIIAPNSIACFAFCLGSNPKLRCNHRKTEIVSNSYVESTQGEDALRDAGVPHASRSVSSDIDALALEHGPPRPARGKRGAAG